MMKKLRLLLLDACVVIELFRLGLWNRLVDACDIHLSQTVAKSEAQFYFDDQGDMHLTNLASDISHGRITVFDVSLAQLSGFLAKFDNSYLERLDPGETESLVHLMSTPEPFLICSADSIVFKVLGNLLRAEQGVSLQEILDRLGLSRHLTRQFTKPFREEWTNKGFQEHLAGIGHKP